MNMHGGIFQKKLFLAVLFVGLVATVFVALSLKDKLVSHPVYTPPHAAAYVDLAKIAKNLEKKEGITVNPAGTRALLPGAKWVPQTFNNCAPATVSMVLEYFGYTIDQNTTKAHLRTNPDDKNVFTYEIRDYLKTTYDIDATLFYNGDIERLKLLVANGFYVVVENWLHPNEDIGHVTIVRGYDDEQGVLIADDSYLGVNIIYPYEEFDKKQWKAFNREYLPLYTADKEPLLKAIVGDDWDEKTMYEKSLQKARTEIEKDANDMNAWFNLGSSYYGLGEFEKARDAFATSQNLGWPRRMLWYQIQPVQTSNELGEYEKALELATRGLWYNDSFPELHYEKARSYKGLGDLEKARDEINKALSYAPQFQKAHDLLASL